MQLAERTFIVTGGGSGLGAATARMLVEAGGNVALVDHDAAAATAMTRTLGDHALAIDAAKHGELSRLVEGQPSAISVSASSRETI